MGNRSWSETTKSVTVMAPSMGEEMTTDTPGSPRVLIVDDDQSIRRGLRSLLEDEGVQVVAESTDGADALNVAWRLTPDVVFMDLRMPGMGGIEATRHLTAHFPTMQVIVCTAYDDDSLHQGATEAGAYAVLVKGCPPDLLIEMMERAWDHKCRLEQRYHSDEAADHLHHTDG